MRNPPPKTSPYTRETPPMKRTSDAFTRGANARLVGRPLSTAPRAKRKEWKRGWWSAWADGA